MPSAWHVPRWKPGKNFGRVDGSSGPSRCKFQHGYPKKAIFTKGSPFKRKQHFGYPVVMFFGLHNSIGNPRDWHIYLG